MSRSVTITDVAAAAGCSVATVSRALRNYENVAPATAARVKAVATELGYRANRQASQLRSRTPDTMYIVLRRLDDPYYSEMVAGAEAVASDSGFDTVLSIANSRRSVLRTLARANGIPWVAGAIVIDIDLETFGEATLPAPGGLVVVGGTSNRASSVTVDEVDAGDRAATELLENGHRSIGIVSLAALEEPFRQPALTRAAGVRRAVERIPGATTEEYVVEPGIDGGAAALALVLAKRDRPTAVVCTSADAAFGFERAARSVDLRVPEDLSIVSVGDTDLTRGTNITAVGLPVAGLGARAAELLITRDEGDAPAIVELGLELHRRTSVFARR